MTAPAAAEDDRTPEPRPVEAARFDLIQYRECQGMEWPHLLDVDFSEARHDES